MSLHKNNYFYFSQMDRQYYSLEEIKNANQPIEVIGEQIKNIRGVTSGQKFNFMNQFGDTDLQIELIYNKKKRSFRVHRKIISRISNVIRNLADDIGGSIIQFKAQFPNEIDILKEIITCFYEDKDIFMFEKFKSWEKVNFFLYIYNKYDMLFLDFQPNFNRNLFDELLMYYPAEETIMKIVNSNGVVQLWKPNIEKFIEEDKDPMKAQMNPDRDVWIYVNDIKIQLTSEILIGFVFTSIWWSSLFNNYDKYMVENKYSITITEDILSRIRMISPANRSANKFPWYGNKIPGTGFIEYDLSQLKIPRKLNIRDFYREYQKITNRHDASVAEVDRYLENQNITHRDNRYYVLLFDEKFYFQTSGFIRGMKSYYEFTGLPEIYEIFHQGRPLTIRIDGEEILLE